MQMRLKNKRGDESSGFTIILALIILLVGLAIAYIFLKDSVDPLLNSKLGTLFDTAKFD